MVPAVAFLAVAGSPRPQAKTYPVTGVLVAPAGSVVTLTEAGGQEIVVTAKRDGNMRVTKTPFTFPKPIEGGKPYSVAIKKGAAALTSVTMKNGQGVMDASAPGVLIVCDLAADLASRSTDNKATGTFYDSTAPVIGGRDSDDGRYVAFVSYAAGLGGSSGKKRQIFWRDRHTGETLLISATSQGGEGNGDSGAPAISADGRSVAFESYATNLVPIDTNKVRDVFVWNADRKTITAVSDAPGGIEANAEAFEPTISENGRFIAFSSSASTLTEGVDGTSQVNVFLKDMESGAVTLISRSERTNKAGGGSRPSISDDGSRIAFYSYPPLQDSDVNNIWDIYVWDRSAQKLKRVTLTYDWAERTQGDESASRVVAPAISGNGRFVTYTTTAPNVVPNDTNKVQDVFIVQIDNLRVARLSLDNDAAEADADTPVGQGERVSVTRDANWVVFTTSSKKFGGGVVMKSFVTGETRVLTTAAGSSVGRPEISRDGGYVVFGTSEKMDPRFPSSGIFVRFTPAR